jgi:hypothetical protein
MRTDVFLSDGFPLDSVGFSMFFGRVEHFVVHFIQYSSVNRLKTFCVQRSCSPKSILKSRNDKFEERRRNVTD